MQRIFRGLTPCMYWRRGTAVVVVVPVVVVVELELEVVVEVEVEVVVVVVVVAQPISGTQLKRRRGPRGAPRCKKAPFPKPVLVAPSALLVKVLQLFYSVAGTPARADTISSAF